MQEKRADISVAVITATYNSEKVLPRLIASLQAQTDRNFTWVVCDGGSNDRTIELIKEAKDLEVDWDSRADFGIYDALNRGLRRTSATHYIVAGSDDYFHANAIELYRRSLHARPAALTAANIVAGERILRPRGGSILLNKQMSIVAGHSLGVLVERALHERHGYYSKRYPIAADQLFLERAYLSGEAYHYADFTAGVFGEGGVSSTDVLGSLTESFRIHVELTGKVFLNLAIFLMRVLKNARRL